MRYGFVLVRFRDHMFDAGTVRPTFVSIPAPVIPISSLECTRDSTLGFRTFFVGLCSRSWIEEVRDETTFRILLARSRTFDDERSLVDWLLPQLSEDLRGVMLFGE